MAPCLGATIPEISIQCPTKVLKKDQGCLTSNMTSVRALLTGAITTATSDILNYFQRLFLPMLGCLFT